EKLLAGISPIGHPAEPYLVVFALPGARIKGREEHFAAEAVRQLYIGLYPVQIPECLRLKKLDLFHAFEGHPDVGVLMDALEDAHRKVVVIPEIAESFAIYSTGESRAIFLNAVENTASLEYVSFANAVCR